MTNRGCQIISIFENQKQTMDIWVKIGVLLIVVHLVAGFGWLVYKLSPRRKPREKEQE